MSEIKATNINQPRSLRAARLDRGLTQEKLAADLGVRQGYISNCERGHKNPGPMFRHFLSHYFGLPVDVVSGWFSGTQSKAA